jgi:hypothetical protein
MRVPTTNTTKEFGDFQTPEALARDVCSLLSKCGLRPAGLLEPTCGLGRFLLAGLDEFSSVRRAVGADINAQYVKLAQTALQQRHDVDKVRLVEADFFATDWQKLIAELPQPVLALGNLPWVTNSHLGTMGSDNMPVKTNLHNHNGLDAITGKANFDISEWMLIRLLEAFSGRQGALAMLCKSSVARKALRYGWKKEHGIEQAAIYRIDADRHFDVAVDAVLLALQFGQQANSRRAEVYPCLSCEIAPEAIIGYADGMLLADATAYQRLKHLAGEEIIKWRSGIKHDCAKVMELRKEGSKYRNGLGEVVELEDTYLFPMLKSSQVARAAGTGNRFMLVPQRAIGDDTRAIAGCAPRTWDYLTSHAPLLDRRGSSIYRKRPPFSIFGVGDYSFAPWKVAISGFYKNLRFMAVGPASGRPVVLDDTSYFLPCQTRPQAELLARLLNSPSAQEFYSAFVFWDAKRPITADLLRRLDLRRLAEELGLETEFNACVGQPERSLLV